MLLFNEQVFRETLYGQTAWESDTQQATRLGLADHLTVGVEVSRAEGTSPKLTVDLEHSNDGEHWVRLATLFDALVLSTTDVTVSQTATQQPLGVFVRLRAQLSGV